MSGELQRFSRALTKRLDSTVNETWDEVQMATTLLDSIVVLLCPLGLSAVWIFLSKASAGTDEISEVVKALTRTHSVEKDAEHGADFSSLQHYGRNLKQHSRSISVSIRMHAAHGLRNGKRERPSDEKSTLARRCQPG